MDWKVKVAQSCRTLCDPHGLYSPWNSPGQDTGVGSLSLLQGIFPTQESNQGLLHCGLVLYQLSHQGSPRILEWVAYPFSRGSFWSRNQTRLLHCRQILYQLSSSSNGGWRQRHLQGLFIHLSGGCCWLIGWDLDRSCQLGLSTWSRLPQNMELNS